MKKLLITLLLCLGTITPNVLAAENIKIYLNEAELAPLAENHQEAIVQNDVLYLPLRNLFEAVGFSVEWDDSYREVTGGIGSIDYTVKVNKNTIIINGTEKSLENKTIIVNDRTLLSEEGVKECLDANVLWKKDEGLVYITYTHDAEKMLTVDFSDTEGE